MPQRTHGRSRTAETGAAGPVRAYVGLAGLWVGALFCVIIGVPVHSCAAAANGRGLSPRIPVLGLFTFWGLGGVDGASAACQNALECFDLPGLVRSIARDHDHTR